jgi:hypothetical protein
MWIHESRRGNYINHLKRHKSAPLISLAVDARSRPLHTAHITSRVSRLFLSTLKETFAGNLHCFMAGETLWRMKYVDYCLQKLNALQIASRKLEPKRHSKCVADNEFCIGQNKLPLF